MLQAASTIGYTAADAERAMREVLRRVRETPDIENAAVANTSLLSGGWSARNLTIQSEERIVSERPVPFMRVSPGFFPTLGTQVFAGRDFDERDVHAPGSPPREWQSVIVNESFVRRFSTAGTRSVTVSAQATSRAQLRISRSSASSETSADEVFATNRSSRRSFLIGIGIPTAARSMSEYAVSRSPPSARSARPSSRWTLLARFRRRLRLRTRWTDPSEASVRWQDW